MTQFIPQLSKQHIINIREKIASLRENDRQATINYRRKIIIIKIVVIYVAPELLLFVT